METHPLNMMAANVIDELRQTPRLSEYLKVGALRTIWSGIDRDRAVSRHPFGQTAVARTLNVALGAHRPPSPTFQPQGLRELPGDSAAGLQFALLARCFPGFMVSSASDEPRPDPTSRRHPARASWPPRSDIDQVRRWRIRRGAPESVAG